MKKLSMLVGVLFSMNVLASQEIYNALSIEEDSLLTARTERKLQKSIGGISCIKVNHVVRGDSFSCEIDASLLDSSLLYNNLEVEEKSLPAQRTQLKYEKRVGKLSCVKVNTILKGDSFNCKIKL